MSVSHFYVNDKNEILFEEFIAIIFIYLYKSITGGGFFSSIICCDSALSQASHLYSSSEPQGLVLSLLSMKAESL